jgi:hypothetical protein
MNKTNILIVVAINLLIASTFYFLGGMVRQHAAEMRALEMNKECYDGFDILYITQGIKDKQQHNDER